MTDEIFGQVVSVQPDDTPEEAVAQTNATDYGRRAGAFKRDLDRALAIAVQLRVGAGVIKISRAGVRYAMEATTEPEIAAIRQRVPGPA